MRTLICRPFQFWGERGAQSGQKKVNNVIAKPAHMESGLQHQAGAGPPRCRGSATPWLACPSGGGRHSVQRAPLSTNGEQVGHYHPKFEGGKVVSAVVMPPQAHRELQGKQNKTNPRLARPSALAATDQTNFAHTNAVETQFVPF